jgi:uncharacterized protein (TIGR02145 family)
MKLMFKISGVIMVFIILTIIMHSCKKVAKEMSVSTGIVTNSTSTTADVTGTIIDLGNGADHYGHCYSTSTGPTINSGTKKEMDNPIVGEFTSNLIDLTPNTKYYVKAYLRSGNNVVYGSEINFTTGKTPPTATVADATLVTNTTATLNGVVNAYGNSTTVTFEYGLTTSYGLTETATQNPVTGVGTTNVNASIIGLSPNTIYHFRAKAVNGGGTTYSGDNTFKTTQLPTAITEAGTTLTNTTATLNGTVNATNLSTTVTFEYGTTLSYGSTKTGTPNPVTGGTSTSVNAGIIGLKSGLIYHYRVKAENTAGITYGDDITFTTTVKDPDGNNYNTVTIIGQVWMKENLKTSKYKDGGTITLVSNDNLWTTLATPGYCWFNNNDAYKDIYGALYNWYAVNTGKLCPTGWHVPSDTEWTTLITNVGSLSAAGGRLKETGTTHWSGNIGATNDYGFTALPGGLRREYIVAGFSTFFNFGIMGIWWTMTTKDDTYSYCYIIQNMSAAISQSYGDKKQGFSVRCLRD